MDALRVFAREPEAAGELLVEADDEAVVVRDKYAKARRHFLVLLRGGVIDHVDDLRSEHAPQLDVLEARAQRILDTYPDVAFRIGFHAVPSMRPLHLHVISRDMDAPALKNKKHWHSFTSPDFFLDLDTVRARLAADGKLDVRARRAEYEAMLKHSLSCHGCHLAVSNMPKLKAHIAQCRAVHELSRR